MEYGFRKQLRIANEIGLNVVDLMIADELNCTFGCRLLDDEFERLCDYAKKVYLKGDTITVQAVCEHIDDYIDEDKTVDEIVSIPLLTFITETYLKYMN